MSDKTDLHVLYKIPVDKPTHERFFDATNAAEGAKFNVIDAEDFGEDKYPLVPGGFKLSLFAQKLSTRSHGDCILYAPTLDSTQEIVAETFKELPVGTLCIADKQTKGRGRTGNSWETPEGQLAFTIKVSVTKAERLVFVQYVAGIAMLEGIEALIGYDKAVKLKLKWPNDIYCGDTKVGGIICNSDWREQMDHFQVAVGIGLDVDNEQPTTAINKELRTNMSREDILMSFLSFFENDMVMLNSIGFKEFNQSYMQRWMHTNQKVQIKDQKGQKVPSTITGITKDGFLEAKLDSGETVTLHPDNTSVDLMQGLIIAKEA
eukprot:Clim_evm122s147 gene=Clim_evmTU122s147